MKKYSEDLLQYIKELKYARTSEDQMFVKLSTSIKVRNEYDKLNYKERKELESKV